jgi:hypothetical protein
MTDDVPTNTPMNGKLDIALRVIFGGLFVIGLVTGYVMKPRLDKQMREFLKGSYVENIEEVEPEIELPFLPWGGRILSVWHRYQMPGTERNLLLRSYFSRRGEYRATQTNRLPTLGARRSAGDLEVALLRAGEHYYEPGDSMRTFRLTNIMEALCQRIDTNRILGFIIFPIRYAEEEGARPEDAEPAIVMHLWCETSETDREENEKPCPEAARIVYSLESNSIVTHDELL